MKYKVKDTSSQDLVAAFWSETLSSAWKKMKLLECRHLPVINDSGELVGIISDRDIQRGMTLPDPSVADRFPQPILPDDAVVADFMSSNIVTIQKAAPVTEAARLMIEKKISAVIVVDDRSVAGLVTSEDLLRLLVTLVEDKNHPIAKRFDIAGVETSIGTISHLLAQAGV